MKRTILVLPALAFAAACGGGGDGGDGGGDITPAKVAEKAGCSDSYQSDTTQEIFVRELGKCTIGGSEVSLYTFASNENRDNWVKAASQFGGMHLVIDKAVLTSDSRSALETAKGKAGGDLK